MIVIGIKEKRNICRISWIFLYALSHNSMYLQLFLVKTIRYPKIWVLAHKRNSAVKPKAREVLLAVTIPLAFKGKQTEIQRSKVTNIMTQLLYCMMKASKKLYAMHEIFRGIKYEFRLNLNTSGIRAIHKTIWSDNAKTIRRTLVEDLPNFWINKTTMIKILKTDPGKNNTGETNLPIFIVHKAMST